MLCSPPSHTHTHTTHTHTLACASLGISYIQHVTKYGNPSFLTCPLGVSSYRWWRATDSCGPFSSFTAPLCTSHMCQVNATSESLQRYFYYCCTEGNVDEIEVDTQKACFHVASMSVCVHHCMHACCPIWGIHFAY